MTEFAGYLNDRGYAVTQDKISRFLSLKNEETDFTSALKKRRKNASKQHFMMQKNCWVTIIMFPGKVCYREIPKSLQQDSGLHPSVSSTFRVTKTLLPSGGNS